MRVLQKLHNMRMKAEINLTNLWIKKSQGIGVVEIILILVVLIALVVIFRDKLKVIVEGLFTNIIEDVEDIKK